MQYALAIDDATKRLAALVTNILKLNKLENQQIFPENKEIVLSELVCECMLEFETGYVVDSFKGTFDAFEERYAPLTPDAIKVIELCRQRQRERGVSDQGYIFSLTDEISSGLWESIENRMERYSQIVTGEKKSLTKARKTFISTALDAGINPDTVRRVVGHRDIQTTLNNYYFDRSSAEERAKQFAEAFDKQPIFEALESSDSKMEMSDSKSA